MFISYMLYYRIFRTYYIRFLHIILDEVLGFFPEGMLGLNPSTKTQSQTTAGKGGGQLSQPQQKGCCWTEPITKRLPPQPACTETPGPLGCFLPRPTSANLRAPKYKRDTHTRASVFAGGEGGPDATTSRRPGRRRRSRPGTKAGVAAVKGRVPPESAARPEPPKAASAAGGGAIRERPFSAGAEAPPRPANTCSVLREAPAPPLRPLRPPAGNKSPAAPQQPGSRPAGEEAPPPPPARGGGGAGSPLGIAWPGRAARLKAARAFPETRRSRPPGQGRPAGEGAAAGGSSEPPHLQSRPRNEGERGGGGGRGGAGGERPGQVGAAQEPPRCKRAARPGKRRLPRSGALAGLPLAISPSRARSGRTKGLKRTEPSLTLPAQRRPAGRALHPPPQNERAEFRPPPPRRPPTEGAGKARRARRLQPRFVQAERGPETEPLPPQNWSAEPRGSRFISLGAGGL